MIFCDVPALYRRYTDFVTLTFFLLLNFNAIVHLQSVHCVIVNIAVANNRYNPTAGGSEQHVTVIDWISGDPFQVHTNLQVSANAWNQTVA